MLNKKDLIILLNKFIGQIKLFFSQLSKKELKEIYSDIITFFKNLNEKIKNFSFIKLFKEAKNLNSKNIIEGYIIAFKEGKLLEKIKIQLIYLLNKLAKPEPAKASIDGLLGININNDQIALVHVVYNENKKIIIKSKGIFKLNITDFNFQDQEQNNQIHTIISNYIESNNLIQVKGAYVLVGQQYIISLIELPSNNDVNISKEKTILLGLKDYINYSLDDAILDSFEIPVNRSSDNAKLAYGIATRAKLSQDIGKLLNKCNIYLKYIDITELCIRNIVSLFPEMQNIGCLVLKIFANNSSILLMKNKDLYICRNTTLNINQLDNFDPFKDDMAEKISIANNLLSELQRSLDYANNIFREVNFNSICILPSGLNLEKIIVWLKEQSGLQVYQINLNKIIELSELSLSEQTDYLLAIGAALRNIN